LTKLKEKDGDSVTFGNNDKSKIIGIGNLEYKIQILLKIFHLLIG
jgi:hypothetical protein